MAFTDFRTTLLDALWDLLTDAGAAVAGTTPDKIRAGNRIDPTTAEGFKRDLMERTAPGDFPRLVLHDAGLSSGAYAVDPAFAAEELDSPDGFSQPVQFTLNFDLTLQSAVAPGHTPMAVYNPLESAVFQALVRGGPRLGLWFVLNWRVDVSKAPGPADLPGGQKGYEGRYRVVVPCMAESRDIISPNP